MKVIIGLLLVLSAGLSGCATPGRWVPLEDPVAGVHYPCCWYPHGYYRFIPDKPLATTRPKNMRSLMETVREDSFPQNNDHPFPGMVPNTPSRP